LHYKVYPAARLTSSSLSSFSSVDTLTHLHHEKFR
jgi:hypothetical protein